MTDHPITPPPELVKKWMSFNNIDIAPFYLAQMLATQAARWGADQELEACIQWIQLHFDGMRGWCDDLRAARRPKPPSLKEQALAALDDAVVRGDCITVSEASPIIRRALESLPE